VERDERDHHNERDERDHRNERDGQGHSGPADDAGPDSAGLDDAGPANAAADNADHLIRLRDQGFQDQPVELIAVDRLSVDFSPRVEGEDEDYVRALAETTAELPPILAHRATMTVVDGAHRLRAARLRGAEHIAVRFFDGGLADARLLAVATNIAHGRPLSTADRAAAATRIFASHPRWSDRAVAAITGLSAKKVARLRGGSAADPGARRIGRDGRSRPVDSSHGRELAGRLILDDPGASLRQIAAKTGLAPATVADVRARIRRGESPVLARPGRTGTEPGTAAVPGPTERGPGTESGTGTERGTGTESGTAAEAPVVLAERRAAPARSKARRALPPDELLRIFDSLRRDPSLRFSEAGRSVLRVLDACALVARDPRRIAATVPPHCKDSLAQLAQGYAGLWQTLADDLGNGRSDGDGRIATARA
jgi:ParB-like chromosome segregation protein Spo0J